MSGPVSLGGRAIAFPPISLSWRRMALVGGGAAAAAGGAYYLRQHRASSSGRSSSGFKLPRPVMEATCGAVGEIVAASVLYPIDTIKVSMTR